MIDQQHIFNPDEFDQIGRVIEPGHKQYQIFEQLGTGGQGTCFRAVDNSVSGGLEVCLKVVFDDNISTGIPRSVRHTGIVQVIDSGQDTVMGIPLSYVAYEFIRGESLEEWTRQESVGVKKTCEVLIQICDAIQTCHNHLVAHRDLKPSNIMMEGSRPIVVDFGISSNGRIKSFSGSPMYMAPEQAAMQEISTLVDVYGIGAIGYYMLTGEAPNGSSITEAKENLRTGAKVDCSSLPGSIRGVIEKCLDPRSGMRYQSVSALREDLEKVFEGRVPSTRAATKRERYVAGVKRHPVMVASVLLFMIASLVTIWYQHDHNNFLDNRSAAMQKLHEHRFTTLQNEYEEFRAYRKAIQDSQMKFLSTTARWHKLYRKDEYDSWSRSPMTMMSMLRVAENAQLSHDQMVDLLSDAGDLKILEEIYALEDNPNVDPIDLGDVYMFVARAHIAFERDEDKIQNLYHRALKNYGEYLPIDSPKYMRAAEEAATPIVELRDDIVAPFWVIREDKEKIQESRDWAVRIRESNRVDAVEKAFADAQLEIELAQELGLLN